jgi:hypothetical protein
MPRQRLLPHGQHDRPFILSLEALRAAAKASGIKLKRAVIARIILATMAFVAHGQIETSAPSLAAVRKIKKLLELTISLRKDFPNKNREEFFSEFDRTLRYVSQSKDQFDKLGLPFCLELLSHTLEVNQTLLENTLRFISDSNKTNSNGTKGDSWDLWIYALTLIFRAAKLPTEIRRDDLGTSPFVAFVNEIQNQLPDHLKVLYKVRSLEALATAMNRATKESSPALDAISVDTFLRIYIGAWKPVFKRNGIKFELELVIERGINDILEAGGPV